ncbi:hypothetical protein crov013 [Cafeteria roenbergensis virus]|uniref:Amine oxidase domain-containing protein n=1 Tax=Cafeteria roenbergensis virus (strain BV-PW1) TaxID=693272 RepID=E3T4D3_CROVB|nr:ribonucleotide reductase large subunit [Cafeteria roenbergensis virus BV-PW1]ADO67046.1 hypothetical protein crov013 [Cafeteria roenbergensis virus BV-PW1]
MKIYDYIIYGGGPTGMTLAYILAKNKLKVALVEKDSKMGGCWKVEWYNNKYFTEHSPRVLMEDNSSLFKLFNQIGYDYKKNTIPTYGNLLESNFKFIKFFYKKLLLSDYYKIIYGLTINYTNLTVTEWLNKINISESGKKAFNIFSILLANSPDKLLVSELFISSNFPVMFLQFKNNEEWINLLENKLVNLHVDIFKNHELTNLIYYIDTNKIEYSILQYNKKSINLFGKNHLLTLPPKAMYNLLLNQIDIIRNNWPLLKNNNLNKWLDDSTYYSFGFQLHFNQSKIENPRLDLSNKELCWSCSTEYNLILLPTSDYSKIYSKDSQIKTVWSCTIVDTNVLIKKFNKTVNQMTKKEIINDIVNELLKITKIKPKYITFYDGLKKEVINGKEQWISKDSAFSVGKSGIIPSKGLLSNLEWIGPHNKTGITVINKAVNVAVDWCKNKNMNVYKLDKKTDYISGLLIIVLFVLIVYYFNYKK